jgi:predicted nuclease of predicted toxin-antitoxin system
LRKPSATSSQTAQPELPDVYIDECLSQRLLADALTHAGVVVHTRRELFPPGVRDQEWLSYAGNRGWIVLTKDKNIQHRPLELDALFTARVRTFVLASAGLTGDAQASLFVRILPKIRQIVATEPAPFIVRVHKTGKLDVVRRA